MIRESGSSFVNATMHTGERCSTCYSTTRYILPLEAQSIPPNGATMSWNQHYFQIKIVLCAVLSNAFPKTSDEERKTTTHKKGKVESMLVLSCQIDRDLSLTYHSGGKRPSKRSIAHLYYNQILESILHSNHLDGRFAHRDLLLRLG